MILRPWHRLTNARKIKGQGKAWSKKQSWIRQAGSTTFIPFWYDGFSMQPITGYRNHFLSIGFNQTVMIKETDTRAGHSWSA